MTKSNYTKIQLSKLLNEKKGFSITLSRKIIDDLLEAIIENIKKNNFNLKNFGSFKILNKKARIGRNPKTKEQKEISSRKVLLFKPSKEFKEFINTKNNE